MTYQELKTINAGFATSHVIDDVINNARFCYGKAALKMPVSQYDLKKIREAADFYGESVLVTACCDLVGPGQLVSA